MLKGLRTRTVCLATLFVVTACGGGDEVSAPLSLSTPKPGYVESNRKARVSITARGAETVDVKDAPVVLHFVEIIGDKTPRITWFFSVSVSPGPGRWVERPDGSIIILDADLSPGLYEGPGTYTLTDAASPAAGEVQGGIGSAAYISVIRRTPASEARFGKLAEPCTVTIEEGYKKGTVDCPKLANAKGASVALSWRWNLT